MNDLEMTESRRLAAKARMLQLDEKRRDLAFVCASPEGQRFLLSLLRQLGLARTPAADEAPLHAQAMRLLRDIAEASPQTARWLLAALYQVE